MDAPDAQDQLPLLEYDRGTIVLTNLSPALAAELSGLVVWDARVNVWRAPAHLYSLLLKALGAASPSFLDQVRQEAGHVSFWQPVSLRPYQEAALLSWNMAGGRGLVCLPTGAGKTRIAMAAMQRMARPTLCLVPTKVLLHQWVDSIRAFYSGDIGILGDGRHEIKPITIATFESAFRRCWSFGDRFDFLVVDEAHHFGDCLRDEALESCPAPFRMGLSATIDGEKNARLRLLIGTKVFEQGLTDLLGSALCDFDLSCIRLSLTAEERFRYDLDHAVFRNFFDSFKLSNSKGSWENFMQVARQSTRGRAAVSAFYRVKSLLALTQGKKTMLSYLLMRHSTQRKLIYTADTATALTIAKEFLIAPIVADITKKERDAVIAAFLAGKIKSIVSCKVLNEGFDVPEAEVAIILGGSAAVREHVQRIGRVLRAQPDKRAQVYELLVADTVEVARSRRRGQTLFKKRNEIDAAKSW